MKSPTSILSPRRTLRYGLINIHGYLYVYMPNHPDSMNGKRYVALHRLIYEYTSGQRLNEMDIVHHIDGDTLNNHPSNLEVLTAEIHNRITVENRSRRKDGTFI